MIKANKAIAIVENKVAEYPVQSEEKHSISSWIRH